MATQNNAEAVQNDQEVPEFEQQVNSLVSTMTLDDQGKYRLPEGDYSEALKFSANAERRRRDTESSRSKQENELKVQKALVNSLQDELASSPQYLVPDDVRSELESLKYSDPDAYRLKMNELESEARKRVGERSDGVALKTSQQIEQDRRRSLLDNYNTANPDKQISPDTAENDLPPSLLNKLENGDVSFEEFLVEANRVMGTGVVIGSASTARDQPNLGSSGGSSQPSNEAYGGEEATYEKAIF
tara:strand:+ start:9 stop:743 length:735 start_codon:yes stop_codon:yes gene_type:complete